MHAHACAPRTKARPATPQASKADDDVELSSSDDEQVPVRGRVGVPAQRSAPAQPADPADALGSNSMASTNSSVSVLPAGAAPAAAAEPVPRCAEGSMARSTGCGVRSSQRRPVCAARLRDRALPRRALQGLGVPSACDALPVCSTHAPKRSAAQEPGALPASARASEVDRKLHVLTSAQGRLLEPFQQNAVRMLRLFNLCDFSHDFSQRSQACPLPRLCAAPVCCACAHDSLRASPPQPAQVSWAVSPFGRPEAKGEHCARPSCSLWNGPVTPSGPGLGAKQWLSGPRAAALSSRQASSAAGRARQGADRQPP